MKLNINNLIDIRHKDDFIHKAYFNNHLIFDVANFQNVYVFDLSKVANNKTITLKNRHSGTYTDWGDGVVDKNTTHTYANVGIYTVKTRQVINSSIGEGDSNTQKSLINCTKIDNSTTSCNFMFENCSNLLSFSAKMPDNIISCKYMFQNCTNLSSFNSTIPDTVKDSSYMFYFCTSLSTFNTTRFNSIVNCRYMFYWCTSLSTFNIVLPNTVQDCNHMFYCCTGLNSIPQGNINIMQAVKNGTNTTLINYTNCYYNCTNITSPQTYATLQSNYPTWF